MTLSQLLAAYQSGRMEEAAEYTTLVVSEREFLVNRNELVEKSTYFKAMLKGGFVEAGLNRIKLTGIEDPEAFAVLLEFILTKRISLKVVLQVLKPVLVLADMMNEDSFTTFLKEELFRNWSCLEKAQDILQFSEALEYSTVLSRQVFDTLKNAFETKGGTKADGIKLENSTDCCSSVVDNCPSLVVDLCGAEIGTFYWFPDSESRFPAFVRGITDWIVEKKLDETSIRKVARCFGVQYLHEKYCLRSLFKQSESQQMKFLEKELNNNIQDARDIFRKHVSRVFKGAAFDIPQLFYFDAEKWAWEEIDLIVGYTSRLDEQNARMENTEEPINNSIWFTNNEDFLSFNCTDGPLNKPFYCSTSYSENDKYDCCTLVILELKRREKRFSTIFKTPIAGNIEQCSLCRLDDVLHGFMTYMGRFPGFRICHFALQRNKEEDTWCNSEFHLDPLLCENYSFILPVATTVSEGGILVLFDCEYLSLWVTLYNVLSGSLQPLALLPTHPQPQTDNQFYANVPCTVCSSDAVLDDSATLACTFLFFCCNTRNTCRLYQLSSVAEPTRDFVSSPSLGSHCIRDDHSHAPVLKQNIDVCPYSS